MQVTDELRVLVEAEVARAIENFKKFSDGVENSEKKTASLGEALDSLSKKSLIISGVLGGAGIAAVKFAGENEKLKLSLKNMLSSAEEAASVFEDWRKLGASPGLNTDEVFSLGKAMVNMGKDTRYATSTIEMLGNIAAGTGVSFGEISGSFEHVRAVGNLTTRDLVSLQQKGIPIVKQLAKEMGTSEDGIKKLAAEGKIGFSDLERAFKSMTSPGGQFAGMMNELSGTVLEKFSTATADAKQALAAFGETLLPIAADLLDGASSILHGITDMDEGTKRFVLGMGGVIAVSGPVVKAIMAIKTAMTAAMANPYMLAIAGVITAVSVVTGLVYKQANAYEDLQREIKETDRASKELLASYSDGNDEKILDEKTTRELIKLYPELSGEIKANNTTVKEAIELQKKLNAEKVVESQSGRMKKLIRDQEEYRSILIRIRELEEAAKRPDPGFGIDELTRTLEENIRQRDVLMHRIHEQQEEINEVLSPVGKRYTLHGAVIDIPVTASVTVDMSELEEPPAELVKLKKTWQEWFSEIAKVDPALFVDSGAKAAQLYIANFERGLTAQTSIAEALDQQLDIAPILRSRQSDVQNALVELLSIDPEQINQPFELMDKSIQALITEYRKLGEEAKTLEDRMSIEDTLKNLKEEYQTLSDEVQGLTKDKYDLALITMKAAGATDIEIEKAEELIESIRELSNATEKAELSFEEFLSRHIADKLSSIFPELEEQAAEAFANISTQLSMMSFDGLLDGLSAIGEAFALGENAAENFKDAMADMAQQILNQLPNMFLQAGLQLIAQRQLPLGLGFIAASGTSALIGGFVSGTIAKETEAVKNAHGNVFSANGIIPYAHGGSFTNQIVNSPTYFRHGGKLGVMGEAGPESIMPLRRMANGDLGVAAQGGGGNVNINIINYTGADAKQEEHTDAEGNKQIDVIIGSMINNHISSGNADRALSSRYGIRAGGV